MFGGLDPCYTFDLGSPDRVRRAVQQAINSAAARQSYERPGVTGTYVQFAWDGSGDASVEEAHGIVLIDDLQFGLAPGH